MTDKLRSFKLGIPLLLMILLGAIPIVRFGLFALSAFKPGASNTIVIEVRKGQNPNELTHFLTSNGIISDGRLFTWLGRLGRKWKKIKAGEYLVSPSMTPLEIFSTLNSGISITYPVTVREGENIYEIANDLVEKKLADKEQFLNLCKNQAFINSISYFKGEYPSTLEGYFYPDTYFFNRTMTQNDIIKQMVKHFFENWGPKEEARAKELNMTLHQITTLASIIEKETGAPEERPLISSIFHNRLRKHMKLQSDPTTIYGMWHRYEGKIHKKDLAEKNDYNTYTIEALPIGPIGNPGKDAIQAALFPVTSSYLFFVSHNDGTHQFSQTIEEHNLAVRKFQLDPKAREGKSWRDRLKKQKDHEPAL